MTLASSSLSPPHRLRVVWLTDVAGLSPEEAVEVMRWSAYSLLGPVVTDRDTGDPADGGRDSTRATS